VTLDIIQRLPATLTLIFCFAGDLGAGRRAFGSRGGTQPQSMAGYLLRVFSVLGMPWRPSGSPSSLQLLFAMDLGWLPLRRRSDVDHGAAGARHRLPGARQPDRGRLGTPSPTRCGTWCYPRSRSRWGGLATIVRFTAGGRARHAANDFVFYERAMGYAGYA